MKKCLALGVISCLALTVAVLVNSNSSKAKEPAADKPEAQAAKPDEAKKAEKALIDAARLPKPGAIPAFVHKGLGWLVEAQHKDGGWGGGSHANQQLKDPHKVDVDPATTAFAALTLLRAGNTTTSGSYQEPLRKATEYLVKTVEQASESGPRITEQTGTQPQAKLGQIVDTPLTAQYLARILPTLKEDDALRPRVDAALSKCLKKLQGAQAKDGSWNLAGGGWAPVLQSSLSCSALELAAAAGKPVDGKALVMARNYQTGNVDVRTGRAAAGAAAGVELYAFSGAQKANAADAVAARSVIQRARRDGKLAASEPVTEEALEKAGVADKAERAQLAQANRQSEAQLARLSDETLLKGFGNNGGEEFLSYLMTSESLILLGGEDWSKWNTKIHERLEKCQNPDGSWSGHHCITSPVFCTAAVIQCLTTDRDGGILLKVAQNSRVKLSEQEQKQVEQAMKEAEEERKKNPQGASGALDGRSIRSFAPAEAIRSRALPAVEKPLRLEEPVKRAEEQK